MLPESNTAMFCKTKIYRRLAQTLCIIGILISIRSVNRDLSGCDKNSAIGKFPTS